MSADAKTLFEIYREGGYNREFRYILYTDLEEHARDREIARAASGDTVFSGFLDDDTKAQAVPVIEALVTELNDMDEADAGLPANEMQRRLQRFLVP